jgi:acyl dehydratase
VPLDYQRLMGFPPMEAVQDFTFRDTILYALGVGAAADAPTDCSELQYVYEDGLKALPTMATVMGYPGYWAKDPKYGLTWQKVLLGEQSMEIHRTLPVSGRFRGVTAFDEIYDLGAEKGAVLHLTREVYDDASGEHLATVRQTSILRADGGFGGKPAISRRPSVPERAPDYTLRAGTRSDQALLYRLSGDYNPLHADPEVAHAAGFAAPILHGLATFGIVGRLILKRLGQNVPERMRRLDARFSNPVYPGETLALQVWEQGSGRASFRVRVPERDATVLQIGHVEFDV